MPPVTTLKVDLVCVGSGAAGGAAALAAAAAGLRVALIERSDRLGGGTCYSYGGLWVGTNHLQSPAGIDDSSEETRDYLQFLTGGAAVPANLDAYVAHAPRVVRALDRLGVRFRIIPGVPDHYYPSAPGSKSEGRTLEPAPLPRSDLGPWAGAIEETPYLPPGVSWSDAVAWGGPGNLRNWDATTLEGRRKRGILAAGQQFKPSVRMAMQSALGPEFFSIDKAILEGILVTNGYNVEDPKYAEFAERLRAKGVKDGISTGGQIQSYNAMLWKTSRRKKLSSPSTASSGMACRAPVSTGSRSAGHL